MGERVDAATAETDARLAEAEARWDREKALAAEILDLRAKLRGEGVVVDPAPDDAAELLVTTSPRCHAGDGT